MSTSRQRPRHKHDWETDTVSYFPRGRSLSIVWFCGTRGCGETRTEQAKPRKPAATALTDLERVMQTQKGHKVKPSQAGWDKALDDTGPGSRQALKGRGSA